MSAAGVVLEGAAWLPLLGALAVKASLVLALTVGTVVLLARSSAAARHLAWCACLAGLIALPFLPLLVPRWDVPVLPAAWAAPGLPELPAMEPLASWDAGDAGGVAHVGAQAWRPEPSVAPGVIRAEWSTPGVVIRYLPLLLVSGTLAVLGWMLAGLWGVARLERRAGRMREAQWREALQDSADRLGLRRRVALLRVSGATMPATWGVLNPRVMLPEEAESWSADRRRAVLAHELAHVKRFDCLTQAVAQVACALYWWHPGVWYAARRMRVERERACDDLVLLSGARASDYAMHLLEIARACRPARFASPMLLAMARPSQLESRLLSVLDPKRRRRGPSAGVALLALGAALALVAPLAAMRPAEAPLPPAPLPLPVPAVGARVAPAPVVEAAVPSPLPQTPGAAAAGSVPLPAAGSFATPDTLPGAGAATRGTSQEEVEQLIAMRAVGVTPEYAARMRELFPGLTSRDLVSLRALDITPASVEELWRAGYRDLHVRQVRSMTAVGVTPSYIEAMNAHAGRRVPADELISLRGVGVTPEYLTELERSGLSGISLDQARRMRAVGVTREYVRELEGVGFTGLPAERLTEMRVHGVTAEFVRELRAAGIGPLSAGQLIRLRISGVAPELLRSRTGP